MQIKIFNHFIKKVYINVFHTPGFEKGSYLQKIRLRLIFSQQYFPVLFYKRNSYNKYVSYYYTHVLQFCLKYLWYSTNDFVVLFKILRFYLKYMNSLILTSYAVNIAIVERLKQFNFKIYMLFGESYTNDVIPYACSTYLIYTVHFNFPDTKCWNEVLFLHLQMGYYSN